MKSYKILMIVFTVMELILAAMTLAITIYAPRYSTAWKRGHRAAIQELLALGRRKRRR